jgi:hypothetical protein
MKGMPTYTGFLSLTNGMAIIGMTGLVYNRHYMNTCQRSLKENQYLFLWLISIGIQQKNHMT